MDEDSFANMTDTEIAWSMRKHNFEKFKTLVRMHLSFELDLNTDEFDLPYHEVIYYEKGKMRKWSRLSRKLKTCASGKTNASPTVGANIVLDDNFIRHLRQLKMFILLDKNLVQEGIFRKTGSVTRQNELRDFVCNDKSFDLSSGYTVHDCATVLKSFLADLHEPVLTDAHYPAHCQIAPIFQVGGYNSAVDKHKEAHILNSMQLLLLLLPNENRILFQDIIEMLHIVSTFKDKNKMSSENLATLFAPHLICPRNLPPEALHYVAQTMFPIIAYMITKGSTIFQIPAKLSTDIRAYYHERKRKKTMSPEQTLDDSISDMSTVNTVYTFVDREKTAAAHTANNTDTELAQLYAHIQSLPESSKKRRLIKQFNKQNGQGTPLQLIMNRKRRSETSKSAKSISDSIKKHIFHKAIISRTPKRAEMLINTQTPIFSTKNSKLRVLFQSPTLNSSLTDSPSVTLANLSTKTHTLQKSISSSSLVLRTSLIKPQDCVTSIAYTSSDESESISFPIQFADAAFNDNAVNSENLVPDRNKKTVVWKDQDLELATPIHNNHTDVNMRYTSEPNLSQIFEKKTNELIIKRTNHLRTVKGVSMGELDVSFSSHNNRRLKYSSLPLKPDESYNYQSDKSIREDILTCEEENNLENNIRGCSTNRLSLSRNYDIITSTPSMLLGRRSMSPITKSTQRMPKAMQESIMTPRSRKPVMLTNNMGISEQTPKNNKSSRFHEQDEDALVCMKPSEISLPKCENILNCNQNNTENKSLSNGFREYLLSRSLLTASPQDSSFFSQPDDFRSAQDINDLDESQLSTSLLHCLDGHHMYEGKDLNNTVGHFLSISNTRWCKGIAIQDDSLVEIDDDKLVDNVEVDSQKMFINEYDENSRETSF